MATSAIVRFEIEKCVFINIDVIYDGYPAGVAYKVYQAQKAAKNKDHFIEDFIRQNKCEIVGTAYDIGQYDYRYDFNIDGKISVYDVKKAGVISYHHVCDSIGYFISRFNPDCDVVYRVFGGRYFLDRKDIIVEIERLHDKAKTQLTNNYIGNSSETYSEAISLAKDGELYDKAKLLIKEACNVFPFKYMWHLSYAGVDSEDEFKKLPKNKRAEINELVKQKWEDTFYNKGGERCA